MSAGEDGEVAEDRLATVPIARGLDGNRLHDAAKLVDDERGQRLALDVLGDHDQRLAGLADRFEQRHQILGTGDLLLEDQDVGVFHLAHLRLRVGHEVGREETAVELHALDDVHRRLSLLPFLDGDHSILAYL